MKRNRLLRRLRRRAIEALLGKEMWQLISTESDRQYGRPNPDPTGAFLRAHQKVAWVYICVTRIAQFAAGIPLKGYEIPRGKTEDEKEALPYEHDVNKLFRYVNPIHTRMDLTWAMVGYLLLRGDCFVLLDDYKGAFNYTGPPKEMFVLRPDRVTIVPAGEDGGGPIAGYMYKFQGRTYKFAANEVLHLKTFNPYDDWHGQSAVQAGQQTILTDYLAEEQTLNLYKAGGIPPGYLQVTGASTADQRRELGYEFNRSLKIEGGNAKIPVLRQDVDWKQTGLSQDDMQSLETREFTLKTMLALFGVPPVIAGLVEGVNYRTADVQTRIFAQITGVQPWLSLIGEQMTQFIGPQYGDNIVIGYDTSKHPAFQEDQDLTSRIAERQVKNRIMTPNQVRKTLYKLDEGVPGGDTFFIPSNWAPIETDGTGGPVQESAERSRVEYTKLQAARWERLMRRMDATEQKVRPYFLKMFRDQEAHAIKLLYKGGRTADEAWVVDRGPEDVIDAEQIAKTSDVAIRKALLDACKAGIDHGKEPLPIEIDFTINDPAVVEFMDARASQFISETGSVTKKRLRKTLAQGMDKGESMKQIEARISKVFKGRRGNVGTIARTEVHTAIQDTQNNLWQSTDGMVDSKEWISALIETTRGDHADEHGHVVKMGKAFPITHLEYPGDSRGPADQTVNCICDMIPVLNKEKKMDALLDLVEFALEPVVGPGGKGSRLCRTQDSLKHLNAA